MPKGVKLLDAYVEVDADASGVVPKVKGQIDSGAAKVKGSGSGIGKALVGGIVGSIAVAQIGSFIGDSLSKSSDLNETINKASAIFGKQADSMEAWASTAATTLGLSKGAALDAAASFGDMFTQIGFTGDAAADMSKNVVTAAADLGSFSNLDTADVSDRIAAAMRGEYDSLQAVIPNINAARVESEALAATGKKTAKELTAQEKATAVMAIVTKDGARAMGDFAKTSDSAANRQKIAAAQTEDLQAAIGTGLAPILNNLLGIVVNNILPMLQQFATWVAENQKVVIPLAIALGVLAGVVWVVNAALAANPIVLIIIGIGLLIAAIIALVMNWDTVVKFLLEVWGGFIGWITDGLNAFVAWWNELWAGVGTFIADVWNGFIGWIVGIWNGFTGWIRAALIAYVTFWLGVWTGIGNTIRNIWNGFIGFVRGVWSGFIGWIGSVISGFAATWRAIWGGISSFFGGIWSGITSAASGAINNVVGFISGLQGRILGILSGAAGWLSDAGRNVIQGFMDGITGAWQWVEGTIRDLFGGVVDLVKGILGIHSPSIVFEQEIGEMIPAGAQRGVKKGTNAFRKSVADMVAVPDEGVTSSGSAGSSSSGTPGTGGAATIINIENVTVEATQMSDMQKAIETLKSFAQVSRQGQGIRTTAGMTA